MKMNNFFKKTRKDFDTDEEWRIFVKLRAQYLTLKEEAHIKQIEEKYKTVIGEVKEPSSGMLNSAGRIF